LFLDEVGDIPVEIQPKLLRALQEREFERLGSTHTKRVNVRLVAATNRNLEKMIEDREFRSDLYYRLNVFPIRIPPLRERREDIPLLTRYFAEKFARQMQKPIDSIPASSMAQLQAWHWPGNVRELENLIERSVILTTCRGSILSDTGTLRPGADHQSAAGDPRHSRRAQWRRVAARLEAHDAAIQDEEAGDHPRTMVALGLDGLHLLHRQSARAAQPAILTAHQRQRHLLGFLHLFTQQLGGEARPLAHA
jgi:transcriptional regulator with GAF, ATPase, and Fis domain